MKYYLIVGEASGDLHASHLMTALKQHDSQAQFRYFGGDNMTAVGGERVRHFKELAYMGFIPVLIHLPTILSNMRKCKRDIVAWQPDVVILVDYAGFNLSIAKFLTDYRKRPSTQWKGCLAFYYIAPKLWAWKEWRIKNIKRDVQELFSILPFEEDFFTKKHHYPIHYVGNPTADEVRAFRAGYKETELAFRQRYNLDTEKPIIALLAGSRKQEIKDNLPVMLEAVKSFPDYQPVLACAPGVDKEYYDSFISGSNLRTTHNDTYALLSHSAAALVTSGTATLETALFNVPQVVCYKTPVPRLVRWAFNHIIKCRYISLVNLIADKEVVPELFADRFSLSDITKELSEILPGSSRRETMLREYDEIDRRLGNLPAADNAAREIIAAILSARSVTLSPQ